MGHKGFVEIKMTEAEMPKVKRLIKFDDHTSVAQFFFFFFCFVLFCFLGFFFFHETPYTIPPPCSRQLFLFLFSVPPKLPQLIFVKVPSWWLLKNINESLSFVTR